MKMKQTCNNLIFSVIEKKEAVKIRDAYGNEGVQNVADIHSFQGGSDSLHKVPKWAGRDKANNDFIDKARSGSRISEINGTKENADILK